MPRRTSSATRAARTFVVLLIVVGLPLFAAPWWPWGPPGKATHDVTIPAGATLYSAATRMYDAEVITSARQFTALARVFGRDAPIRAGVYRFVDGRGWGDYLRQMQKGDIVALRVTIPEGLPAVLVRDRLLANAQLTGPVAVPAEGSVLPDTYDFQVGSTRAAALRHMQAAMTTELATLWKTRTPAAAVNSPADAVILASIVEKETALPAERRLVAGVYSNRLRQGIKLDADPTVIYPITAGKPLGRRILRSELARPGLAIGPFGRPGLR